MYFNYWEFDEKNSGKIEFLEFFKLIEETLEKWWNFDYKNETSEIKLDSVRNFIKLKKFKK